MKIFKFSNGDVMPNLGLGTWKSEPGEVYNAILEAIKIGYRHFDCAYIYMNEAEIGNAFQKVFQDGLVKREELWITSKLWNNSHAQEDVLPAIQKTLADLKLDYLDLYLIHWPIALKADVVYPEKAEDFLSLDKVPMKETWQAMEQIYKAGLTRHIGVSNFSVKKLREVLTYSEIQPEMNQLELHPLLQQNEMLSYCNAHNIFLTGYSPLGSRDRIPAMKGANEPNLLENPTIVEIANSHDCSPAQVLIRWAMQRGTVVIPKSVNAIRLKQNFESLQFELNDEAMDKIGKLDQHFRFLNGVFWAQFGSSYTVENLWDD